MWRQDEHEPTPEEWAEIEAADERERLKRERMLSAAVRAFIAEDDINLALALLDAEIDRLYPWDELTWVVPLLVPAESYQYINGVNDQTERLWNVFAGLVPHGKGLKWVEVRVKLEDVQPDWRDQVRAGLEGGATNQGVPIGTSPIYTYQGLNYRSKTEIKIAEELTSRGILFFPNSRASRSAVVLEPDFLIVHQGRMGIIEVDGPTHHGKAAEDHKRDLFFQQPGILLVKHFTAADCYNNPKLVVDTFLGLLTGPSR